MGSEFAPRPVTLTGEFVRLEPLAERHVDDLLVAGADERIWTWMPRGPFADRADALAWIREARAPRPTGPQVALATVDLASGKAVGSTRYLDIRVPDRGLEIGWTWLAPGAWRTALNTEAKLLQLTQAFEGWGAERVQLKTDARNERSMRSIERLGAEREGTLRRHMLVQGGVMRDTVMYSIIADEWPAVYERLRRGK